MAKFETISKYAGHNELIPIRKTQEAAGYDFVVAEDTLIPPYEYLMSEIVSHHNRISSEYHTSML